MDDFRNPSAAALDLAREIGAKAEDAFGARETLCSQAVACAVNGALAGPLDEKRLRALAAAFPEGLGNGCLCGALGGAMLVLGLFLGDRLPQRRIRKLSAELHEAFKAGAGGCTCCRALKKRAEQEGLGKVEHCRGLTRAAAELVAGLILRERPDLAKTADASYLDARRGALSKCWERLRFRLAL